MHDVRYHVVASPTFTMLQLHMPCNGMAQAQRCCEMQSSIDHYCLTPNAWLNALMEPVALSAVGRVMDC